MNAIRFSGRRCLALAVLLAAGFATPFDASAQIVTPGATRVQQSDPALAVGALMLFDRGTTKTFVCTVAWGVRSTSDNLVSQLRDGRLTPNSRTGVRRQPSRDAQRRVLTVLERDNGVGDAARAILSSLTPPQFDQLAAQGPAQSLVEELTGLFEEAVEMDPREPGYQTATGLAAAVLYYNEFIDAADLDYFDNPSDEFLTIEAVLRRLVQTAIDNEGRPVDLPSWRGDYGLPCAPAPVAPPEPEPEPEPPPRPPLPERAIEVCVYDQGELRFVPATFLPETGDTLVLFAGERRKFSDVYAESDYASELDWVKAGEMIELGRERYTQFGRPSALSATDRLVYTGTYRGVRLFAREGAGTPPGTVYLPFGPRCQIQPYQLAEPVIKGLLQTMWLSLAR